MESLHLNRPAEIQPKIGDAPAVQLRTVEHYCSVMGLDGDIDPELGQ